MRPITAGYKGFAYNSVMNRVLATFIGVIGVVVIVAATVAGASPDRVVVRGALEGYEWSQAKAAADLGGAATPVLMAIAEDESVPRLYRQRAIATLGRFDDDDVVNFLTARLDEATGAVERRRIADTLCGLAASRHQQVEASLLPLLQAEDPHLRVRAARCLDGPGFGAPAPALEDYRRRVQDSWEARAAGLEYR